MATMKPPSYYSVLTRHRDSKTLPAQMCVLLRKTEGRRGGEERKGGRDEKDQAGGTEEGEEAGKKEEGKEGMRKGAGKEG